MLAAGHDGWPFPPGNASPSTQTSPPVGSGQTGPVPPEPPLPAVLPPEPASLPVAPLPPAAPLPPVAPPKPPLEAAPAAPPLALEPPDPAELNSPPPQELISPAAKIPTTNGLAARRNPTRQYHPNPRSARGCAR